MKKSWQITIFLVFLAVFISGCSSVPQGERPGDTAAALRAVQSGTQGIQTQILPNSLPDLMYDNGELIALVEVRNKGNHDLEPQECFVQATGFDTNIIRGGFDVAQSCSQNSGILNGKNVYNTQGDFNQIEFRSPSIQLPEGVFDYNPRLNFVTCYNYHTTASPSVCVDPLFYQVSSQQKACTPAPAAVGGGQGAPVGVSYVGVSMVGNKAIFEINVQNVGGGRVLSPFANIQNCGKSSLDYKDFDQVMYDVQLNGGTLISCKPSNRIVRLNNGQGKIVCSYNIPGSSAFETPLLINFDYGYMDSFQQSIKIVKTPQ